jgi:hypothetical protein
MLLAVALAARGTSGARGDTTTSLTTDTSSGQFATDAEKMAFLRRYVVLSSAVETAEFHILYHDNSGGRVPGPSDWDMRVALNMAPADVSAWTSGLKESDGAGVDLSPGTEPLPNKSRWAHTSQPQVYQRANSDVIVAVFAAEAIVLKHLWTA